MDFAARRRVREAEREVREMSMHLAAFAESHTRCGHTQSVAQLPAGRVRTVISAESRSVVDRMHPLHGGLSARAHATHE